MTDNATPICTTPLSEASLYDIVQELERRDLLATWIGHGNADGRTVRQIVQDEELPADDEDDAVDLLMHDLTWKLLERIVEAQEPGEAAMGCSVLPIDDKDMAPGSSRLTVQLIALNLSGLQQLQEEEEEHPFSGLAGGRLQ